jgi:hypothetical protein
MISSLLEMSSYEDEICEERSALERLPLLEEEHEK